MRLFLTSCAAIMSVAVIFSSGSCAGGQKTAKEGYLWEISGNGLTESSYLFGTYHGTFDIAYNYVDSIPGYHEAFDSAQLVVVESDPSDKLTNGPRGPRIMMDYLPVGVSYEQLLSPENFRFLDSLINSLSKELSFHPFETTRCNPAFLIIALPQMMNMAKAQASDIDLKTFQVMDTQILRTAKEHSKKTGGLEAGGSVDLIDFYNDEDKSLEEQAEDMVTALKYFSAEEGTYETNSIVTAYRSGELKEMERYGEVLDSLMATISSAKKMDEYNLLMDKLIRVRNEAWMEKIPNMLAAQPTFIAVGARHLPGEVGLIAMLREKGYSVTPVN
jgi:uncharacterized protein YbaP (TraB family)